MLLGFTRARRKRAVRHSLSFPGRWIPGPSMREPAVKQQTNPNSAIYSLEIPDDR